MRLSTEHQLEIASVRRGEPSSRMELIVIRKLDRALTVSNGSVARENEPADHSGKREDKLEKDWAEKRAAPPPRRSRRRAAAVCGGSGCAPASGRTIAALTHVPFSSSSRPCLGLIAARIGILSSQGEFRNQSVQRQCSAVRLRVLRLEQGSPAPKGFLGICISPAQVYGTGTVAFLFGGGRILTMS